MHKYANKHIGCIGDGCPHCVKLDLPENAAMRAHLMPAALPVNGRPLQRPCIHLGEATGKMVRCEACKGTQLKTFTCSVYGACTLARRGKDVVGCCKDDAGNVCPSYRDAPESVTPATMDGPLRVVFASHVLDRGGASIHLANIVPHLRNITPIVWAPHDGPLRERYEAAGLLVTFTLHGRDLSGVDLVVANSLPAVQAVAAAKLAGVPCCWLIHESVPDMCGNLPSVLEVLEWPETIIFPSQATASAWAHMRTRGVEVVQSVVPPVPMRDRATARAKLLTKLRIDADTFVIVSMGHSEPRKGHTDLVQAISGMNKVTLITVADEPDPWTYYAAADVYVCSSRVEAFPLALQEAAAYGVPLISTDVFGCREIVQDGVNGILYRPGDVAGLQAAIDRVRGGERFKPLDHLTTFDGMLTEYERIFREAAGRIDSDALHVVYHVAGMGTHWKSIVGEQLGQLAAAGLTTVLATHVGEEPEWLIQEANRKGIHLTICQHEPDVDHCERLALRLIERLVMADDKPVLYLHSKGVSHPLTERHWHEWRRLMMRELVGGWRQHVRTLAGGDVDAVGVNWWEKFGNNHFSGNFWMASASWIRKLPRIDRVWANRYAAEVWIGVTPGCRAKSLLCHDMRFWDRDMGTLFSLMERQHPP